MFALNLITLTRYALRILGVTLLLHILLGSFETVKAQDEEVGDTPSPGSSNNAGGLGSQVNLYGGVLNLNLPIAVARDRNLNIPISLVYNGGGIKVQDMASWVGLGWSLNAGGSITRVVQGLPDDHVDGYCGVNNIGEKAYESPLTSTYVFKVGYSKAWDPEPDLFYFSFPGNSGKFILDEAGVPRLLSHSNMKIMPGICPNTGAWTITDASGIQYIFGKDADSRESTLSGTTYISSWYLSEIKFTAGTENVKFFYESDAATSYTNYNQSARTRLYKSDEQDVCVNEARVVSAKNVSFSISSPKYLQKIQTSFGYVEFLRSSVDREDLAGGKFLERIVVKDNSFNIVDDYRFSYTYFLSDNCSTLLCKRLKLNAVKKQVNSSFLNLYSFVYSDLNLPSRDSHQIDHWGYYNSNNADTKIPRVTDNEPGTDCHQGVNHSGAIRDADVLRSQACILKKILLPTGGHKEFIYDAHEYVEGGVVKNPGGARIKTIKECLSEGNCISTVYDYSDFDTPGISSGLLFAQPRYHYRVYSRHSIFSYHYFAEYLDVTSYSVRNLFDLNGNHISYANVSIDFPQGGYIRNTFNDISTHPDTNADQFLFFYTSLPSGVRGTDNAPDSWPYTPGTSKEPERGLLTERSFYSAAGKLLMKENYIYNYNLATIKAVPCYKALHTRFDGTYQYFQVGKYFMISKPYTLDKVTTTAYDQSTPVGDLTGSEIVSEFSYDMQLLLPKEVSTYSAAYPSQKKIVRNKYVNDPDYHEYSETLTQQCETDYTQCTASCNLEIECLNSCFTARETCIQNIPVSPEVDAINLLNAKHQWSQPIETQTISQSANQQFLISATVTKFLRLQPTPDEATHYVVPKEIYNGSPNCLLSSFTTSYAATDGAFQFDASKLRKISSFDTYDLVTGNLLAFKNSNGIAKVAQLGFNNNHVQVLTSNPNDPAPGSPDVQHQTSFDYKPLVGVIRETDANQRNRYLEYDAFGNLLLKKNHNSHITERYRSNYVNSNLFGIDLSISGTPIPTNTIFCTSQDNKTVGVTKYVWDFGDGQVTEGTTASVSHSYASAGTFTVKLAKINPEFGSVTTTQQLTIYSPPLITLSQTCSNFDICDPPASCNITASVSGGCPNLSFQWYHKPPGGGWTGYGTGAQVSFSGGALGTHEFKCVVSENTCGRSSEDTTTIQVVGDPGCPQN